MRVVKPHVVMVLALVMALSGAVLAQDATPTPTPEPQPLVLTIWWPDVLAAPDNEAVQDLLAAQTQAFVDSRENVIVESRLKKVGTTGGIMATLRTGSFVAPDALPTLTLIRRQDLVVAERAGLLQSMEGMVPSSVQGDLGTALQLGQVNGELYGVPYLLELQHVVYRQQANIDYSSWTFPAFLERESTLVFVAGREGGLSNVVLLQYLAAGGSRSPEGDLSLDTEALNTTLAFYEQAAERELIPGTTTGFVSQDDYLNAFVQGDYDAAVLSSTQYLRLHETDSTLRVAPIPTASGEPNGLLNGWLWVLINSEPEHQALAMDYVLWMMGPARQSELARTVYMIPSRLSTLERGLAGDASVEAYQELLDNPVLPLIESGGGVLARTMQEALSSVMTQERTAAEATQFVLDQQPE